MRIVVATLVVAAILAPACGGKGSPAAPTAQTLQGTWRATKAEFVSVASSSTRMDVVAQGATVTMAFSGNNYTFTMTTSGQAPEVQTGTWSASKDVMTLVRTGSSGNQQFDMTFSGNNLTLNNGSAMFDFNTGNFVEARLSMTLVRQ
jgi:uncharacterized protein YdeI (BOF family)